MYCIFSIIGSDGSAIPCRAPTEDEKVNLCSAHWPICEHCKTKFGKFKTGRIRTYCDCPGAKQARDAAKEKEIANSLLRELTCQALKKFGFEVDSIATAQGHYEITTDKGPDGFPGPTSISIATDGADVVVPIPGALTYIRIHSGDPNFDREVVKAYLTVLSFREQNAQHGTVARIEAVMAGFNGFLGRLIDTADKSGLDQGKLKELQKRLHVRVKDIIEVFDELTWMVKSEQ